MEESTERKDLEVLWTTKQVADYFSVSIRTVYGWLVTQKVLNPAKIIRVGSRVRIPRSEVERVASKIRVQLTKK